MGFASSPRDSCPVAVRNAARLEYFTPPQSTITPGADRNSRSSFTVVVPTDAPSARMLPDVRTLFNPLSTLMLLASRLPVDVVISMPES